MNRATQLALNRINQRFYASIAQDWPHKRKHPWPGFTRIAERCLAAASGEAHVLDVGCGDGRFAQFLAEHSLAQVGSGGTSGAGPATATDINFNSYLGIDNSPALLACAAQRALPPTTYRFAHADFVATPITEQLGREHFQLIVLLGVLHHIPGHAQREALIRDLGKRLAPGGHLVFTVWRLDEDPRFTSRQIAFEDWNRSADSQEAIALEELEPGDTLLRWDAQVATPRYCHFPATAALSQLVAASALEERERFRADGHLNRMNEYVVLQAP